MNQIKKYLHPDIFITLLCLSGYSLIYLLVKTIYQNEIIYLTTFEKYLLHLINITTFLVIIPCYYFRTLLTPTILKPPKTITILFWIFIAIFISCSYKFILTNNLESQLDKLKYKSIIFEGINIIPFISSFVVAPFVEEFFFRGHLYHLIIKRKINYHLCVCICAILWTLCHMNFVFEDIIFIYFIGLVIGYARFFTGSIFVPIVMHISFNVTSEILSIYFN